MEPPNGATPRTWYPDGPGSFRHPEGVEAVTDRYGVRWWRGRTRWSCDGRTWTRWRVLMMERGPLTEEEK